MLTIFAIPKPFQGHIGTIQTNAVQSWVRLRPACEIILCGDDAGVADTAREFDLRHLPNIACNEFGTPLLSSAFESVQAEAKHDLVCYVNADIIFLSDLPECVRRVTIPRFLLAGQRSDFSITSRLRFEEPDWEQRFREKVTAEGVRSPPGAIDYFVFRRGTVPRLPDFAVGRPFWDNWFIHEVLSSGGPVIDATLANLVVHQNHDYGHIPQQRGKRWYGPEADQNRELIGRASHLYTLLDATHVLTEEGLLPAPGYGLLRRLLPRYVQQQPRLMVRVMPVAHILNKALAPRRD